MSIDEAELGRLRTHRGTLRNELVWSNQSFDSTFHATEDAHPIRHRVFDTLQEIDFRVDVTLLDKPKAMPHVRRDEAMFFQYTWFYQLKYIALP